MRFDCRILKIITGISLKSNDDQNDIRFVVSRCETRENEPGQGTGSGDPRTAKTGEEEAG
ncbi:unnamed protein product [Trifolium pratense]|uniref:Uncharacterized protein n=1 Tax=Trifolium pratense TaxID=57577 RepID=A0ACB0JG90_TRIPR|nr:unnamed protein product [Trifolium pratense]